ncbi:MAG: penicillin-insensitive murein endopeptidase [Bdellovibrionales bacterium]|nr:penicillin-insensitive murein endopeptidase [Bdellovibrionales bacterium]
MTRKLIFSACVLIALHPAQSQARADQSVGFYSNGHLEAAAALPAEGPGLLKLFVIRDRAWGSNESVSLLSSVAADLAAAYPDGERLQVGDLSVRNGGRITRHVSHQNGLDTDISFLRVDRREQSPQDASGFDEKFVRAGKMTANFDVPRNWALIKSLDEHGALGRIFVDPVIKATLCRRAAELGEYPSHEETLRRLRPAENHADHLHVRIQCPQGSPRCLPQEEPPPGSGCLAAIMGTAELENP